MLIKIYSIRINQAFLIESTRISHKTKSDDTWNCSNCHDWISSNMQIFRFEYCWYMYTTVDILLCDYLFVIILLFSKSVLKLQFCDYNTYII